MRITSLVLRRYIPFRFSDIEQLELSLPSDIQNIVGTNGSGKSSLLRELNPKPPTRTDFGERGYKRITLFHNGSEYELTSDFSTTTAPHGFVKDGTSLNPSGTTPVQEELVRRELGYTPQVHAIGYGEQRLSAIRLGLRETFLLTIHPCQLKMVMDKHKAVERRLRGFRDNLGLLYERRTALTGQMVDTGTLAQLQAENASLVQEVASLVEAIHKLNNQMQHIQRRLLEVPASGLGRAPGADRAPVHLYQRFWPIPRDQPLDTFRAAVTGALGRDKVQCDTLATQIRTLTGEIDRYAQHLRESDTAGAVAEIETALEHLRQDIAALGALEAEQPFDPYTTERMPEHLGRLTDMIGAFIGYGGPIPSLRAVARMRERHEHNQRHRARCDQDIATLRGQLVQIEKRLTDRVLENIPTGCHGCVLFQQYSDAVRTLQSEHDQVAERLRWAELRGARLARLVDGRADRLDGYQRIVPQMQRLQAYLSENRALMIPLAGIDLLGALRQNPSQILVRIQTHYERSEAHHLRIKKQAELERRTVEHERLKAPSTLGPRFLETLIAEKTADLETLRGRYEDFRRSLVENEALVALIADYARELQGLDADTRALSQQETHETLRFELDLCERYQGLITSAQRQAVTRLAEIERVLREQTALAARLEEITSTIAVVEADLRDFTLVEKALSPTSGIPYRYMIQFINALIESANHFIRRVFSYPFAFIPRKEGDPLDYKFPMRVGDDIAPDISDCSEAQQDMADLAFRLAQFVQLKLTDYPIYLDEPDAAFDHHHKQQLLGLLRTLVSEGAVSQLCMVNHSLAMYGAMQDAETLVLNDTNIILPAVYNEHAHIKRY